MNFKKKLIIAEAGNNHEGSFGIAKKLIFNAKKIGADAIKFQFIRPEFFVTPNDKKRFSQLKSYKLSEKNIENLFKYANKIKFNMFATPFDIEGAKFLNKFQNIFKISSGDNNFFDLMDTVRSFKKPTIISLGIADERLSKEIINFFQKKNFFQNKNNLCLMHCVSSYPADKHLINLNSIPYIQNLNANLSVGFSDHTKGIEVTKMAYLLGARIIEKHFTLSNNFSEFRDHILSLNPKNFQKLISSIKEIDSILGKKKIIINKEELININSMRRKIVLSKDKKKNSILKKNDFVFLRCSEKGILAQNIKKILNKKISQDLKEFTVLKKKYLIN